MLLIPPQTPNTCAPGTLKGTDYLGVHSGGSGLQHSLWLNLLPDGQTADRHGFCFHGLQGDDEEHFVTRALA